MVTPLDQRPRSGPYSGINARSAKRFLTEQFRQANIACAEEDARELVMAVTGLTVTDFALRGTEFLTPEQFEAVKTFADRRLSGEPVDSILGWREFFGRQFDVSEYVLSPRGDTETLVSRALRTLKNISNPNILDLGTGSGAIIITLLAEKADANGVAVDISDQALDVARQNAIKHSVDNRLVLYQGAWFVPIEGKFDLIVSNPPYISDKAMQGLEREVLEYDPDIALRGGEAGLDPYPEIINGATQHLASDGWLWLEIGFDQGSVIKKMMGDAGFINVAVVKDLSGHDRCVGGMWRNQSASEN